MDHKSPHAHGEAVAIHQRSQWENLCLRRYPTYPYVDDLTVAQDTQSALGGTDNGLYIGTGNAMEAGTYWSGLIDDVRIYNRAVYP